MMRSLFFVAVLALGACGPDYQPCDASVPPEEDMAINPPKKVQLPEADLKIIPDLSESPKDLSSSPDMSTPPCDMSETDNPECSCDMDGHGKGTGHCKDHHEPNYQGHGNGHCKYDC